LLFIIPIVVIGWWFLPSEGLEIPQRAFWRTISILVPLGFGVDFFFAHRFSCYSNARATLGMPASAVGGSVKLEKYIDVGKRTRWLVLLRHLAEREGPSTRRSDTLIKRSAGKSGYPNAVNIGYPL
jgi:hypothetical protein